MFKRGDRVIVVSPLSPSGKTYNREFTIGLTGEVVGGGIIDNSVVIHFDRTPETERLLKENKLKMGYYDGKHGITSQFVYAESSLKHLDGRSVNKVKMQNDLINLM